MKLLIVADSLLKIKPGSDSTLAMVRAAIRRKHEVNWAVADNIRLFENQVVGEFAQVLGCVENELPSLGPKQILPIEKMRAIIIRKDPPFDASYLRLCWTLCLVEKKVFMMNSPSSLVRHHEKLIPLEALHRGFLKPSQVVTTFQGGIQEVKSFLLRKRVARLVTKPFFGHAGEGVRLEETMGFTPLGSDRDHLIQPFHGEVVEGDRRVIYLDGKMLAHFVRVPKPGGFLSNLAQGGRAVRRDLSREERDVIRRLGKYLKAVKLFLAGADLIGGRVSEVNVTSPTGLMSLKSLDNKDYGDEIISFIEQSVRKF